MTLTTIKTERTRLKRLPKRGAYVSETINPILDEALICHVGFVVDGQPYVIPTGFARVGNDIYIHGSSASRMLRSIAEARKLGYDIKGLPLDFDGGSFQLRRLSTINEETKSLITVDFLLVTDKTRSVWDTREQVQWGSGGAWVVSREGFDRT